MKRRLPQFTLDVMRIRDFRLLMLTRLFAFMATQAQAVIVGWQIYSLTKSTLLLGLAGLAEALPALFCALFAGHIIDKSRPHRVYILCIGVMALNSLALLIFAGGYANVPFGSVVGWIFAGVFISGIARSFGMPSSFTLFPQVVPRKLISAGAAWQGSILQIGAISGPAIGGLIYGGYGASIAWLLPAGLMLAAFIMLCAMSASPRQYKSQPRNETAIDSIKGGWLFILKSPVLLSVMALDMFAVLFGGAVAILPAYADQVLHVGSEGLGLLRASPAIGAIVIALVLALWPMKIVRGATLLWVVAGFGLSMIGFGFSTNFLAAMLFLTLSGGFDSVSLIVRATLMQLLTPEDMRGRVSSINSMFIISSNEIGAFESGLAATLLGLVPSILFGGIATLGIVTGVVFLVPKLRRTRIETVEDTY
ncbi:MAG: MFS transporter [Pseudomonadota bacterium]